MFESYYKLDANPFRLSADERFRFAHKNYLKAWSYLVYALEQGEGFIMVTGRPGSGKTTLIRDILSEVDKSKVLAINLVTNQLQAEELLRKVALEYGLPAESFNKATLLTSIEDFVTKEYQAGRRAVIVIDEAQNLTLNGLEELRLLSNLQTGSHPLFQIFLIGQDDLRSLILSPEMEQIRQRMIASCQIETMDLQQTEGYIEHRLGIVGWNQDPAFDEAIFPLIHYLSDGIPRKINHIVSRLLLYGALEEKHELTEDDVWIVARELFDEERLSIQSGDSFTTFKNKYGQLESPRSEPSEPDSEIESIERPQTVDSESAVITEPDTGLLEENEARLVTEPDAAPESVVETVDESESKLEAGVESSIESETEEVKDSVTETEDAEHISEFYPYGEDLVDSDFSSEKEKLSSDESDVALSNDEAESLVQPIITEQASVTSAKAYVNESDMDALTSKLLKEGDIKVEDASVENTETNPEDILNLPSMQAERRKHEIDEKGGLINTAETLEVDDLFTGTFGKSLRNIFFLVLAGFFFLALFVIKPERIEQAWNGTVDKLQSMINPAEDGREKDLPSAGNEQQIPDTAESKSFQVDADSGIETSAEPDAIETVPEKVETSAELDLAIVDADTGQTEPISDVESDVETSPSLENIESTIVAADPVERASKDYIATQSRYQKIEIGEGTKEIVDTIPTTRRFQIYFEFDNPYIPDQFKDMLNDLYIVLSLNKASTMTITGYTDASGDPIYNMNLSVERASAVSNYFTERGISSERIQVEGRGPVPKSTTDEHEELDKRFGNRRVEIVLREGGE
ncbi:MAG: AAA family ATPase [Candidatus Thiodiazotropha endolucinida]|uniref:AAA family ATPase n=1 Tax=Candidatus Thiodiazotropha taylori TaxID=2792791 RepID=A0A9E4NGS7_9GAMM|nr:AAA family ATPase [Candidatus Thiodiazotropha sp. (ex Codakia orbicularis)]MCG7861406.1 AAA family ATPase [Candidatus Thiodiazotropha endolucinida]MCG7976911.1 AAA family ATPase [Candidatus Thiodiazotropha taylori]MCW4235031.1 AAA family ATPase [Candidatus Thiodiazotropha endolucinida]